MKSKAVYVTAVIAVLASVSIAGPVADYLGFKAGRTLDETRDISARMVLEIPTQPPIDTTIQMTLPNDTMRVAKETTYQGMPAWLSKRVLYDNPMTGIEYKVILTDTAVEAGDTAMMWHLSLEPSYCLHKPYDFLKRMTSSYAEEVWFPAYVTPFEVGKWWELGIAGVYPIEMEGISGTLSIWGDTSKVVGIEDVNVPYGAIDSCYKIERVFHQALEISMEATDLYETAHVYIHEWYKEGMCRPKDSIYVQAVAYVTITIPTRFITIYANEVGQLLDYRVGLSEQPRQLPAPVSRPVFAPNPFRGSTRMAAEGRELNTGNSPLRIYNSTGRCIRTIPGGQTVWDGCDDKGTKVPAGVYLIRTPNRSYSVTRMD